MNRKNVVKENAENEKLKKQVSELQEKLLKVEKQKGRQEKQASTNAQLKKQMEDLQNKFMMAQKEKKQIKEQKDLITSKFESLKSAPPVIYSNNNSRMPEFSSSFYKSTIENDRAVDIEEARRVKRRKEALDDKESDRQHAVQESDTLFQRQKIVATSEFERAEVIKDNESRRQSQKENAERQNKIDRFEQELRMATLNNEHVYRFKQMELQYQLNLSMVNRPVNVPSDSLRIFKQQDDSIQSSMKKPKRGGRKDLDQESEMIKKQISVLMEKINKNDDESDDEQLDSSSDSEI